MLVTGIRRFAFAQLGYILISMCSFWDAIGYNITNHTMGPALSTIDTLYRGPDFPASVPNRFSTRD